ncbi:MAG: ribosome biogenesis GTPase Der [Candidatus Peribacteraceae bacterium]|nr:ribosome biogenesis GTPase Der [Candidatus Peribacteraceae bacterium]
MAKLPLVAIIGRPNTGKSTLFNRLVRRRVAIESPVAGTTRDHIARKVVTDDVDYLLIDTGGMGGGTADKDFEKDVHGQSALALAAADVILFTLDGKSDLTKSDHQIVQMLRKNRRRHVPVILVITKCDTEKMANTVKDSFHGLGIADDILTTSAAHNLGTEELQDIIAKHLRKLHFEKKDSVADERSAQTPSSALTSGMPRVAIIGRPNVGKSSLINALMSDPQRKISPKLVSDIPGTTRDATDTVIRHDDQDFLFVDTAGLRRKARIEEDLEGLSVLRTLQAIEDCDVAVLLINANEEVSNQDKKIAGTVMEQGKGLIILINKIDLLKGEARTEKMLETQRAFPFCRFAPILPASAKTRDNLPKLFALVMMVHRNMGLRIAPRDLAVFMRDVVHGHPMTSLKSCKHVTQAKDPPPTFVLFVRNPKAVQISQLRYIENRLRERFGLEGVPVRLVTKGPRDRN